MKKTVFLIRNVAPEKYGGGEIYQLKLAGELKKNGFLPIIVTNSEELLRNAKESSFETLVPPYYERQNWSGWRNILLPMYWIYQKKLERWYRKVIRQYDPKVVNIQSRDDFLAATLAAKECGVWILWTDHADFRNWVLWNVDNKFKNIIGKKIIRLSRYVNKVIFVSENIKLETEKIIASKKISNTIVIENGVEDELDEYKKVQKIENSFVFIGRVVKEKGVGELIEAFKVVGKKYPEAKLNIYGDGEDFEKYKNLASGNEKICFYGRTNEPLRAMAENEIFVLPSYREGLSLSLLDAAMMEKKIIASDVDGNSEVVIDKKTGLLVSAKNVEKLTEAIMYMLENKKEAAEMAKNARKYYEKNFDFEKIFKEKMLPLYNIEKEEK